MPRPGRNYPVHLLLTRDQRARTESAHTRTLMSMTHLKDMFKAMLKKLDDQKICTSAPKDNLMMLTYGTRY